MRIEVIFQEVAFYSCASLAIACSTTEGAAAIADTLTRATSTGCCASAENVTGAVSKAVNNNEVLSMFISISINK